MSTDPTKIPEVNEPTSQPTDAEAAESTTESTTAATESTKSTKATESAPPTESAKVVATSPKDSMEQIQAALDKINQALAEKGENAKPSTKPDSETSEVLTELSRSYTLLTEQIAQLKQQQLQSQLDALKAQGKIPAELEPLLPKDLEQRLAAVTSSDFKAVAARYQVAPPASEPPLAPKTTSTDTKPKQYKPDFSAFKNAFN